MRLYTLTGAARVDDPQGTFLANPDGSFDFPNEVSDRLHSFHANGMKAWETDAERKVRLIAVEQERLRDPATMLAAMEKMGANQSALTAALAAALGVKMPDSADATPPAPTAPAEPAAVEPPSASAPRRRGRAAAGTASTPAE